MCGIVGIVTHNGSVSWPHLARATEGMLPQEVEDVVFSLKVDDISPIVETKYGFHIFKVTKKKPQRLQNIDEIRTEITHKIQSEKETAEYQKFINQLKNRLRPQINYENFYFPYLKNIAGE